VSPPGLCATATVPSRRLVRGGEDVRICREAEAPGWLLLAHEGVAQTGVVSGGSGSMGGCRYILGYDSLDAAGLCPGAAGSMLSGRVGECPAVGVGRTEVRGNAAWSGLLLGGLEVGVGARGVVGNVDHVDDLWHRLGDRDLDALAEGDGRHAAPLTAATQA
jgi:hypothetical protein